MIHCLPVVLTCVNGHLYLSALFGVLSSFDLDLDLDLQSKSRFHLQKHL